MRSGAILDGRALAQTEVTLIENTISISTTLIPPDVDTEEDGDVEEEEPVSEGRRNVSGTRFGCKDPTALNYNYFSKSDPSLCVYSTVNTPVVDSNISYEATLITPKFQFV